LILCKGGLPSYLPRYYLIKGSFKFYLWEILYYIWDVHSSNCSKPGYLVAQTLGSSFPSGFGPGFFPFQVFDQLASSLIPPGGERKHAWFINSTWGELSIFRPLTFRGNSTRPFLGPPISGARLRILTPLEDPFFWRKPPPLFGAKNVESTVYKGSRFSGKFAFAA